MMSNTRNDAKWEPTFQYQCSHGHEVAGEAPVEQCPAFRRGHPCEGTLVRYGKGAKS